MFHPNKSTKDNITSRIIAYTKQRLYIKVTEFLQMVLHRKVYST